MEPAKTEIVRFDGQTFGIRLQENGNFYYLDIPDAVDGTGEIDDPDYEPPHANWHKTDVDFRPGGQCFGFCQGDARTVLRAWKNINRGKAVSIEGEPISEDELREAANSEFS